MVWISILAALIALPYAFSSVALFWNAKRDLDAANKIVADNQRMALDAFNRVVADLAPLTKSPQRPRIYAMPDRYEPGPTGNYGADGIPREGMAETYATAICAMLDGVDVGALHALLALAPAITLRQAIDAGVDEALGWDPYALKEGADPHSPAMASWKVEAARKSLDALKEALDHD